MISHLAAPANPLLLALDCSGASCSVALLQGMTILDERLEGMQRGQAEALLPMVDQVLSANSVKFGDLHAVATTRGPGSFTGLRIGIAAARAFAFAGRLPAIGVTAFEAIFRALPAARRLDPVAILIDSKRGSFFAQLFTPEGEARQEPVSLEPEQLSGWLPAGPLSLAGDGVFLTGLARTPRPDLLIAVEPDRVTASAVGQVAQAMMAKDVALPPLAPLYLRAPDVTIKRASPSETP